MSLNVGYKVENSLKGTKEETQRIFEELKKRITAFGSDVKERATKYEIRYEAKQVFVSMRINSKSIKAWIRVNPKTLSDPKKIVKTMKWSPPYYFYINSMREVDYAISLIKQAYEFSKLER
jgi:predicted transport protein